MSEKGIDLADAVGVAWTPKSGDILILESQYPLAKSERKRILLRLEWWRAAVERETGIKLAPVLLLDHGINVASPKIPEMTEE